MVEYWFYPLSIDYSTGQSITIDLFFEQEVDK